MLTVRALGLVAVGFILGVGQGCVSRCSADSDCVKSCPCDNGGNCTIGLSCKDTFCEIDESPMSCQIPGDFCGKYSGYCGSKKCQNTETCLKACNCAQNVPNSNPAQACCYSCTTGFTCDMEKELCDTTYAKLTCDDICGGIAVLDAQCTVKPPDGTTQVPPTVCSARSCQGFQLGQTR